MKVLIWLGCILAYSVLQTVLKGQGIILGGVPTVLLALVLVFLPAPAICKAWDKRKAKKKRWRTPEAVLLCLGFFGGAVGALIGMSLFRHKTRHWYFRAVNLLGLVWQVGLVVWLW